MSFLVLVIGFFALIPLLSNFFHIRLYLFLIASYYWRSIDKPPRKKEKQISALAEH